MESSGVHWSPYGLWGGEKSIDFGLKRAKEEIRCLNVEIRRLLTFLYDDYVDHYLAVSRHIMTDPSLAHEISLRWSYRQRLHEVIVK